jgi:hypothetical protein
MYDRLRAAKALTQSVSLQIGARFRVSQLAFVWRRADTCSAKISAQPLEQSSHAAVAVWAVHPGSIATEITGRPCDLNVLGGDLIEQFDLDQISVESNPLDTWPHELRPTGNATSDSRDDEVREHPDTRMPIFQW